VRVVCDFEATIGGDYAVMLVPDTSALAEALRLKSADIDIGVATSPAS